MYGLSFSEEFFSGDGSVDPREIQPGGRPTSVLQAIISLDRTTQLAIARDVMGAADPELYVDCESFPFDVLDKVRDTDLCDDLSSPVTVHIDPGQHYSVIVHEEEPG